MQKTLLFAFVFLCAAIAQPIVQDGSFEATTDIWQEFSEVYGYIICNAACGGTGARTGNQFVWFGGSSTPETAYVSQEVTLPSPDMELHFWCATVAGPATFQIVVGDNVVLTWDVL